MLLQGCVRSDISKHKLTDCLVGVGMGITPLSMVKSQYEL